MTLQSSSNQPLLVPETYEKFNSNLAENFTLKNNIRGYIEKKDIFHLTTHEPAIHNTVRNGFKAIALLISIGGKIPFIPISMKFAGTNTKLGIVLAYGNVASFTTLIYWAMSNLIDELFERKSAEEITILKNNYKRVKIVASLFTGAISQFAITYLAYEYNHKSILMAGIIIVSDSWLPAYSIYNSIRKIENVKCKKETLENEINIIRSTTLNLINQYQHSLDFLDQDSQSLFIKKLNKISEIQSKNLQTDAFLDSIFSSSEITHKKRDFSEIGVGCLGFICTISQMIFQGTISYYGMKELTGSEFGGAIASSLVVGSNLYLNIYKVPTTAMRIFNFGRNLLNRTYQRSYSEKLKPRLTFALKAIGLINTALCWAPSVQVNKDYFKGDFRLYMQITAATGVILLVTTAVSDIVTQIVKENALLYGDENSKKILAMKRELKKLSHLIKNSSFLDFAIFLKSLPANLKNMVASEIYELDIKLEQYIESKINKSAFITKDSDENLLV